MTDMCMFFSLLSFKVDKAGWSSTPIVFMNLNEESQLIKHYCSIFASRVARTFRINCHKFLLLCEKNANAPSVKKTCHYKATNKKNGLLDTFCLSFVSMGCNVCCCCCFLLLHVVTAALGQTDESVGASLCQTPPLNIQSHSYK